MATVWPKRVETGCPMEKRRTLPTDGSCFSGPSAESGSLRCYLSVRRDDGALLRSEGDERRTDASQVADGPASSRHE